MHIKQFFASNIYKRWAHKKYKYLDMHVKITFWDTNIASLTDS